MPTRLFAWACSQPGLKHAQANSRLGMPPGIHSSYPQDWAGEFLRALGGEACPKV